MIFDQNRYGIDNDTGEGGTRSLTSVPADKNTVWLVTKLDVTTGEEYLWVNPSPDFEPDIANAESDQTDDCDIPGRRLSQVAAQSGLHSRYLSVRGAKSLHYLAEVVNPEVAQ